MEVTKRLLAGAIHNPIVRKCWSVAIRVPIVSNVLHDFARRLLPVGTRVWVRIRYKELAARRYWLSVEPRYEDGHYKGTHEPAVQALLVSHLRPGNCFYDIGAHTGFFSILAAAIVGESGLVAAFEPDRRNASLLREDVERNLLDSRVHIVEQAVWSSEGTVKLMSANSGPYSNTGMSKIVTEERQGSYLVSCTTLDKMMNALPAPTVIKIDVEGAESEVLKGSGRLFESARPIVICEIHDVGNENFALSWLAERKYACHWLEQAKRFPRHLVALPRQ